MARSSVTRRPQWFLGACLACTLLLSCSTKAPDAPGPLRKVASARYDVRPTTLAVSRDGSRVAVGSHSGRIIVARADALHQGLPLQFNSTRVVSLDFGVDDDHLLVAHENGEILEVHVSDVVTVRSLVKADGWLGKRLRTAPSRGEFSYANGDGIVRVRSLRDGSEREIYRSKPRHGKRLDSYIRRIRYSPDGKLLAIAGPGVAIIDVATGNEIAFTSEAGGFAEFTSNDILVCDGKDRLLDLRIKDGRTSEFSESIGHSTRQMILDGGNTVIVSLINAIHQPSRLAIYRRSPWHKLGESPCHSDCLMDMAPRPGHDTFFTVSESGELTEWKIAPESDVNEPRS